MKRLRLRPSPPTPGERNLRLHWQQNSAACNELLKNQRQTASAPTLQRTSTVKNPSLKLNFNVSTAANIISGEASVKDLRQGWSSLAASRIQICPTTKVFAS